MPWKASDAHKHKKGLTPKQARQWAAVANSALKKCESEGGSDCDASAIRQANGAVGEPKAKEVIEQFSQDYYGKNEEKAMNEDTDQTKQCSEMPVLASPYTFATSYAQLEEEKDAREKRYEIEEVLDLFPTLAGNIINSYDVEDKVGAIETLAGEMIARVKDVDCPKDEKKELSDDTVKATWTGTGDLPDSSFLFIEPGGKKDASGKTEPRSLRHLPYKDASGKVDLPHVRNAIARASQIKLKDGSHISPEKAKQLQERAQRILASSQKELDLLDRVKEVLTKITPFLFGEKTEDEAMQDKAKSGDQPLTVWKDKKSGQWMWLARYSNNFKDNDRPPEIISADSHKRFVDMVDKGLTPYPELWLWHIPEWKIGQAKWVAWDDAGFALAAGTFDEGCDRAAEFLGSKSKEILVSHGMPTSSIKRDPNDQSIIVEHTSREISPVPAWAAANPLTGFITLTKEADDMAIPDEKKQTLTEELGFPATLLEFIESKNRKDEQKAASEGLERKENEVATAEATAEVVTEEVKTEDEKPAEDEKPKEEKAPEEDKEKKEQELLAQPPSRQEIADAFGSIFNKAFDDIRKETKEQIEALEKKLTDKEDKEKEAIKEVVALTPAASLAAMFAKSVIGVDSNKLDKKDELSKSKPKEADKTADLPQAGVTQIPFIHEMLAKEREARQ